ncbi:hypothetical protein ES705_17468 [subsurface metagenome]|nr:50S ribosomal protein L30e [Methanosarcinales archaeon]
MAKTKGKSVELSDVEMELQKVISSGKVLIGTRETIKAIRSGGGKGDKIVIHASNCPGELKAKLKEMDSNEENERIIVYEYPANDIELGLACGKPYSIASLCIIDTGESELLRVLTSNVHAKEKTLSAKAGD